MFKKAGQAEIIRSHQKDDFYTSYLRNSLSEVTQNLLGPRWWMKWKKELDLCADLGYFVLTTFAGYQTLGEEYVNIIQVDETKRKLPSRLRRCAMILLHVLSPYFIHKLLDWCERKLQSDDWNEVPMETREFLLRCIPICRHSVMFLHRLHLVAFYLQGFFYHVAKRATGVHYIKYSMRPRQHQDNSIQQSFRWLAWLSLAQLCGSLALQTYRFLKERGKTRQSVTSVKKLGTSEEENGTSNSQNAKRKCSLCLEVRKAPTATPCGHLFCWNCIHEWCLNKPECPLCREKLQPQSLIFLQNFDPP